MRTIDRPGFYTDVPSADYHADCCPAPSLSSGVARTIVRQSPAHAYLEHIRLGGRKSDPTPDMILGGYVHALLSGQLDDYAVGSFDNYTTKAAKEWRDEMEDGGRQPILEKTVDRATRIETALREKAALGITNSPFETGEPEVTAVWQEDQFWFRARYDRLIQDENGFADIWDFKTTTDVSPEALTRKIIEEGYHIQAAHYLRGLTAIAPGYRGRTSFILAFVEVDRPHAVRRVPICEGFLSMGKTILDRAILLWRESLSSGKWPDYSEESLILTPPVWYAQRVMEGAA